MKTVLVLDSKMNFSNAHVCEFMSNENQVHLTEEQKFWHRLYDKALDEIKGQVDSLKLRYLSSISSINLDETLNDEEKSEAVKMVTDELDSDLCQLNDKAKKNVVKMAKEKSLEYLNCVQRTEEEQFLIPGHVSLHEAWNYQSLN